MAKRRAPQAWVNRIVGNGEEPPDQLLANPLNWRIHPQHQQDALAAVLEQVGVVQEIIVNQRSGHLIDGHLRVALAMSKDQPTVPVKYVDLSDEEERLVLATLDPIGALAVSDAGVVSELLASLETDNEALTALFADLAGGSGLFHSPNLPTTGEPGERDFWPSIQVTVSPQTYSDYQAMMDEMRGEDEAERFASLLEAARGAGE